MRYKFSHLFLLLENVFDLAEDFTDDETALDELTSLLGDVLEWFLDNAE